jgi:hypothetical protein
MRDDEKPRYHLDDVGADSGVADVGSVCSTMRC